MQGIVQCRELPIFLLVPLTPSCARRRTGSPVRWLPEPPPRELSALASAVLVKIVSVIMQDTSTRFHDPCTAAFAHRQSPFPLHSSSSLSLFHQSITTNLTVRLTISRKALCLFAFSPGLSGHSSQVLGPRHPSSALCRGGPAH